MAIVIYCILAVACIAAAAGWINSWYCKRHKTILSQEILLEMNRYGPESTSRICPICKALPTLPCYYVSRQGEVISEIVVMRIHSERVGIVSYEKRPLTSAR